MSHYIIKSYKTKNQKKHVQMFTSPADEASGEKQTEEVSPSQKTNCKKNIHICLWVCFMQQLVIKLNCWQQNLLIGLQPRRSVLLKDWNRRDVTLSLSKQKFSAKCFDASLHHLKNHLTISYDAWRTDPFLTHCMIVIQCFTKLPFHHHKYWVVTSDSNAKYSRHVYTDLILQTYGSTQHQHFKAEVRPRCRTFITEILRRFWKPDIYIYCFALLQPLSYQK